MPLVETEARPGVSASQFVVWCTLGTIAASVVGWIVAMLNLAGHAPVGILSLGAGLTLGGVLAGLAATMCVAFGRRLLAWSAVLAMLAVVAEHAWLYHDFRRQWHEARAKSPHVALFRPEAPWSPAQYFTHEFTPRRAALWCVDASLVTASTVGAVWLARRMPK